MIEITDEMVANLNAEQRAALAALLNQQKKYSYPYYSCVKFNGERAGGAGGPYTYTLTKGTKATAFSYGLRDTDMTSAGYLAADGRPTENETNLQKAQETIGGETVVVEAIRCKPRASGPNGDTVCDQVCDARWLGMVFGNHAVRLTMDAKTTIPMGTMEDLPGGGGLFGSGPDELGTQPIDGGRPTFHFASNGWPSPHAEFELPEGLTWTPSGNADSMFEIVFEAVRDVIAYSGGQPQNNVGDEAAAAGIRGYTYPSAVFSILEISLRGYVIGGRSRVA